MDGAGAVAEPLLGPAARRLAARAGDVASGRLEAEVLLAFAAGCSRARLHTLGSIDAAVRERFERLVAERVETARPVAYLVGERGFLDLVLAVDESVLVPRPETEHLVELFTELDAAGAVPPGPVADRGTGSGAIALSIAGRAVLACDVDAGALRTAARNLTRYRAGRRVLLVHADGLSAVADGSLAAVLVNPPYVEPHELAALPADVRDHEPRGALVPAEGSVDTMFAALIAEAGRVLRPGGWLLTEVGAGQAAGVLARLARGGWERRSSRRDLAGIERVVAARRAPGPDRSREAVAAGPRGRSP